MTYQEYADSEWKEEKAHDDKNEAGSRSKHHNEGDFVDWCIYDDIFQRDEIVLIDVPQDVTAHVDEVGKHSIYVGRDGGRDGKAAEEVRLDPVDDSGQAIEIRPVFRTGLCPLYTDFDLADKDLVIW